MEAVRTSETSVDNYFTRQYIPEDNSGHVHSFAICPPPLSVSALTARGIPWHFKFAVFNITGKITRAITVKYKTEYCKPNFADNLCMDLHYGTRVS
jgi:hypothetical protein